ncbi:MAG: Mu-like prophage major head subunit gpT family protein [Nannocystis sp.]|nr:Mu-like prophage major head subunit gpT family protein [Nannocystis sp.]
MSIVYGDLLSASLTGARAVFNDSFPAALSNAAWTRLVLGGAPQSTDGKASMQYGWLTSVPKMAKWTGALQVGGMTGDDFTLTNELHKAAFGVERLAFDRDQLGMITPKTQQLAQEAARYPGELILGLINGGGSASVTSPTYDAAAFFGSSRTYGSSGTIDNTIATAGTSVANFRTDLATARATMMAYADDRGRPMNIVPNVILIHPNDSMVAYEALLTGPGASDPGVTPAAPSGAPMWEARGYTVIEDARLTDTAARYFMHVSPGLAPFIFQQEFAPQLESDTTAESLMRTEEAVYAVRGSFQVGYGLPWLCIYTT